MYAAKEVRTSQPESRRHSTQYVPHNPFTIESILVKKRQSAQDQWVREHRCIRVRYGELLASVVKIPSTVRTPYGQAEKEEQLREGRIEQRQWDV